jgi:hypothetical protein
MEFIDIYSLDPLIAYIVYSFVADNSTFISSC